MARVTIRTGNVQRLWFVCRSLPGRVSSVFGNDKPKRVSCGGMYRSGTMHRLRILRPDVPGLRHHGGKIRVEEERSLNDRVMMKGNEAIAEAAVQAGCRCFFGYPITPQNEIPEYMSKRLPEVGGVFLQAESEVSAINMVYGAAGLGHDQLFQPRHLP